MIHLKNHCRMRVSLFKGSGDAALAVSQTEAIHVRVQRAVKDTVR